DRRVRDAGDAHVAASGAGDHVADAEPRRLVPAQQFRGRRHCWLTDPVESLKPLHDPGETLERPQYVVVAHLKDKLAAAPRPGLVVAQPAASHGLAVAADLLGGIAVAQVEAGPRRLVESAAEALVLGLQVVKALLKGLAASTRDGLHTPFEAG